MGQRLAFDARVLLEEVCYVFHRVRARGWHHGWVHVKTCAINVGVRVMNRCVRNPRVSCPCCGWQGYGFYWVDCGAFVVPWVECPHCHAHERWRLMRLFLDRRPPAFIKRDSGVVLHFSPEYHITSFLEALPNLRCIATDYTPHMVLGRGIPGVQADIQHMPFPDACFDGIFCLHVLEHVPDDGMGLAELRRILKSDGEAVIMVPFMMEWPGTVEFPAPDPDQFDHVRGYSPLDFKERLVGFDVEEIFPLDVMSPAEAVRHQIPLDSQIIYLCRRKKV